MRVRMLVSRYGVWPRAPLSWLRESHCYDVPRSVAQELIRTGAAEAVVPAVVYELTNFSND